MVHKDNAAPVKWPYIARMDRPTGIAVVTDILFRFLLPPATLITFRVFTLRLCGGLYSSVFLALLLALKTEKAGGSVHRPVRHEILSLTKSVLRHTFIRLRVNRHDLVER